jgi:hypothetical protein
MPEFTKEDRNLLVRVGKHLRDEIEAEERGEGSTPRRDRLLRDERDLRALRMRLEAQAVPLAPLGPPMTATEVLSRQRPEGA